MELIETGAIAPEVLPVAGFRAHLRLGHGFAEAASDDGLLAGFLRAAVAQVEGRTGKALIRRGFELRLRAWRASDAQPLPLAPVAALDEVALIARDGAATVVDPALVRVIADRHRPVLAPVGAVLPTISWGGAARVRFQAGFGPDWSDLPPDLAQAVLLLAARRYEDRDASGGAGALPQTVAALCAPWRAVRLGGGA